ncbi:hypothetical protein BDA99DRAFT_91574 [Phascolomyces articulosus]|uniref:F-box domain-containing protein n=1 Tax=Phascolomyces articulosus TaxID=60185 RepID=A0AAD5JYN5_9FUNG|nr:hypothetical protein BDA99DRAFT_91574 [Phascolomyces articulosus]
MQNSNNHSNQSFFPKSHNITKEYHSEEEENYYDTEDESFGPLHKRVDFLSLLPYEVVNLILGQLSTSDLITCLDVCPIWLRLLQKLPNLWYEVIAEHEEYHISSYLPLIGNHVHKYRIYYGCQEILDKSVAGILAGTMDNLESLAWDCSDFIGSDVLSCIHHLRSSLTELELVSTQDTRYLEAFNTPSLSSILNACPTLKRLNVSLHDSIIDDPKEDDNWFPQDLKLTHLHWHPVLATLRIQYLY